MQHLDSKRLGVLVLLLGALAVTSGVLLETGRRAAVEVSGPGVPALEDAVVAITALTAALLLGWLLVGVVVSAAATVTCRQLPHQLAGALAPRVAQRLVAAVLGVGLAGPLSGSAFAATLAGASPGPALHASFGGQLEPDLAAAGGATTEGRSDSEASQHPASRVGSVDSTVHLDPGVHPDRGWVPVRPPTPAPQAPQASAEALCLVSSGGGGRGAASEPLVVRRGDTLWDLAARCLGPDATDEEIATEWPRWYAVNRDVVGPDPDHILPGQQLVPPLPVDTLEKP